MAYSLDNPYIHARPVYCWDRCSVGAPLFLQFVKRQAGREPIEDGALWNGSGVFRKKRAGWVSHIVLQAKNMAYLQNKSFDHYWH